MFGLAASAITWAMLCPRNAARFAAIASVCTAAKLEWSRLNPLMCGRLDLGLDLGLGLGTGTGTGMGIDMGMGNGTSIGIGIGIGIEIGMNAEMDMDRGATSYAFQLYGYDRGC